MLVFVVLGGHVALVPVHVAPASHRSTPALHSTPAFPGVPTQVVPWQTSATVQGFESLHVVPAGFGTSVQSPSWHWYVPQAVSDGFPPTQLPSARV